MAMAFQERSFGGCNALVTALLSGFLRDSILQALFVQSLFCMAFANEGTAKFTFTIMGCGRCVFIFERRILGFWVFGLSVDAETRS
jgi:hypothetical protein